MIAALVDRVLRYRRCRRGAGVRLMSEARIVNMRGDPALIEIGDHSAVRGELLVFRHGGRIRLGAWCYVGADSRLWSAAEIAVGDRALIAHGCSIFDNLTHPISAAARHAQVRHILTRGHPSSIDLGERPVTIGDDAWVGAQSVVLRGVTIGEGAIVGAGSVVTADVPPFTIVAGNPARPVRTLTEDER